MKVHILSGIYVLWLNLVSILYYVILVMISLECLKLSTSIYKFIILSGKVNTLKYLIFIHFNLDRFHVRGNLIHLVCNFIFIIFLTWKDDIVFIYRTYGIYFIVFAWKALNNCLFQIITILFVRIIDVIRMCNDDSNIISIFFHSILF